MDKLNEIDRQLPNVYMLRKRCMEFITILAHHQSINRKYGNELAADAAQAGQNAADSDTPLLARQEADSPAETPQSVPLLWVLPTVLLLLVLALALLHRARRTPLQTVQAEFCALHRKMRRCGLAAEVSSDEAAFAEFLQTHCPQTDRETVQHLLDAVQAAQFAPDPCTAETAQEIQTLCRKLRKKLCRRTV